ncbi:RNA-directed DNA polymerase, eukaryota, reverse transcriptase zinc-binding domain protein [Tanacetum coccineum]
MRIISSCFGCSLHVSMFKSGFLDSRGGIDTEKKSNVTRMSGSSVDSGFPSLSQVAGTTRQDGGLIEGNTITVGSDGQVAEASVVSSDTPNATSDLGNDSNPIEANLRKLDVGVPIDVDYDVWLPLALVHEFSSTKGVDLVLRDGPWMIRGVPIFLKEELSRVLIWVKFYDVPLVAHTSYRLSLIATKIGTPMMLDSYTNSMCLESYGRSSYARILIKIDACIGFSDNLIMAIFELKGPGYTKETIRVEYDWEPPRCSTCLLFGHSVDDYPKAHKRVVNRVEKGKGGSSGADEENFIEVKKKKSGVKVNQTTVDASPKKASSAGKSSKYTDMTNAMTSEEGNSSTPLVEKIHRFEQQLIDRKCMLVDEDGKPVENVDYSGDHGSEDEVEPDDNKMTGFLASKPSGLDMVLRAC